MSNIFKHGTVKAWRMEACFKMLERSRGRLFLNCSMLIYAWYIQNYNDILQVQVYSYSLCIHIFIHTAVNTYISNGWIPAGCAVVFPVPVDYCICECVIPGSAQIVHDTQNYTMFDFHLCANWTGVMANIHCRASPGIAVCWGVFICRWISFATHVPGNSTNDLWWVE